MVTPSFSLVGFVGCIAGNSSEKHQYLHDIQEPAIGRAAKLSGMQFTPGPDEMLDLVEDQTISGCLEDLVMKDLIYIVSGKCGS